MVDTPQSMDGYKCSCGFVTDNKTAFITHLGKEGREAKRRGEKSTHKSEGRVDLLTGEITMPPYVQRSKEQLYESNYGKKSAKAFESKNAPVRTTDVLMQAAELKFVPRVYTTTYTPIMMQAQDAAVKYLGWRSNMPLENFLDTVLFFAFKQWGITLGQYTVDERLVATTKNDNGETRQETAVVDDNKESGQDIDKTVLS
jgi:hypothetical protein